MVRDYDADKTLVSFRVELAGTKKTLPLFHLPQGQYVVQKERETKKKSVWFILLISFAYLHVLRARMGVHRAS